MKSQHKSTSKTPIQTDSCAETGLQRIEEIIATRAYYLWESAGKPDGRDQELWLSAKEQLEGESQS